jgi:uncharacterized membrane protein
VSDLRISIKVSSLRRAHWNNTTILILGLYPAQFLAKLELVLSISSLLISAYLGYILLYVLKDLCLVCFSTYTINLLLFFISARNYRAVRVSKANTTSTDYSSILDGRKAKKRV